ncbi:MAG: DVU_1553 family AMP-dependent CoA ligase [Roseiarcus sp.]|jgi:phenylacetate-coenzyme A ligase PaaK-like adenylate-forming protein
MVAATLDRWMAERMGLGTPSASGGEAAERRVLTHTALEAWQLAELRATIAYARAASPFYRARHDWPDIEIRGLEDVARLPFTRPADLLRNDPPFLALSQGAVARVVTLATSGTSGPAKRLHFTAEDQEATIDFFHHGMALFARPGDRVAIAFAGERPGGVGDGLATAVRRLGATPLLTPLAPGPAEFAERLRAAKPDVVAGPPVPLLAAARVSASDGGAPIAIRAALLSSDHVAKSLSRAIAKAWGVEVFEHWGMTETGYGGAVDCAFHCGCHLRESELYVEVVDPVTGARQPPGALGEVVVTTLRRRSVPLLRYRTGDLARLIDAPCACGSALRRLADFSGRIGAEAPLPGGGALTLPRLDEALFAIEAIADFSATVEDGAPMVLALRVATASPARAPAVAAAVRSRLAADPVVGPALASGALRLDVELADGAARLHDGKRRLHMSGAAACARCC